MYFKGKFDFLSNFYKVELKVGRFTFPGVEYAYQACKTLVPSEWDRVLKCKTPAEVKKLGRVLTLRPDWNERKFSVMRKLVEKKFEDKELLEKLRGVEGEIIEENWWHDGVWGRCVCGKCNYFPWENRLGKILMDIRGF